MVHKLGAPGMPSSLSPASNTLVMNSLREGNCCHKLYKPMRAIVIFFSVILALMHESKVTALVHFKQRNFTDNATQKLPFALASDDRKDKDRAPQHSVNSNYGKNMPCYENLSLCNKCEFWQFLLVSLEFF